MNLKSILVSVADIFSGLKRTGDARLGALDRGVLEVALMVSAIDGSILPEEFACFRRLAASCRGYTPEGERALLDRALRKAGYLMAITQTGAYDEAGRIAALVEMADDALPSGFTDGKAEDVRRAFALWTAMGVSDGDFCAVERRTIEALRDHFAAVKSDRLATAELSSIALCSGYRPLTGTVTAKVIELIEPDFLDKAEAALRAIADPASREKAAADLEALVTHAPDPMS